MASKRKRPQYDAHVWAWVWWNRFEAERDIRAYLRQS